MLKIVSESHLDHGLTKAHQAFIVRRFGERTGFFIETFELPSELAPLECALYGPLAGDEPVEECDVHYARRGDRAGESRLVNRPMRETRTMTVVAGPHGDEPCVLYTSYGGPAAPREPFDLPEGERGESEAFWASHALAS